MGNLNLGSYLQIAAASPLGFARCSLGPPASRVAVCRADSSDASSMRRLHGPPGGLLLMRYLAARRAASAHERGGRAEQRHSFADRIQHRPTIRTALATITRRNFIAPRIRPAIASSSRVGDRFRERCAARGLSAHPCGPIRYRPTVEVVGPFQCCPEGSRGQQWAGPRGFAYRCPNMSSLKISIG
jgi:hypothetical protein